MSEVKTEESAETSHTVVVSRVVTSPVKEIWHRLVTDQGPTAILGEGGILGDKGDSWRAADGSYGVVRTYHPLEQVRFTWHPCEGAAGSLVDLRVEQVSDAETTVEIRHERLGPDADPDAIKVRWEQALSRF